MNKEQLFDSAKQIRGKIKELYSKLTDDDITLLDGKRDQFLGKIQEYYGISKEEAEQKIKKLEDKHNAASDDE